MDAKIRSEFEEKRVFAQSQSIPYPPPRPHPGYFFNCKGKDSRFIVEKSGSHHITTLAKWSKLTSLVIRHVDVMSPLIQCIGGHNIISVAFLPKCIQEAQTEGSFTKYWIRSFKVMKDNQSRVVTNWSQDSGEITEKLQR